VHLFAIVHLDDIVVMLDAAVLVTIGTERRTSVPFPLLVLCSLPFGISEHSRLARLSQLLVSAFGPKRTSALALHSSCDLFGVLERELIFSHLK